MPNFWLIIGIFIAGAIGVVGLVWPFLGMLVFLTLHFIQPGELIPSIASLRLELVYGGLLFSVVIVRWWVHPKASAPKDHILLGALVVLGVAALSVPFAIWPGGAFDSTIELAKLIAIIFLIRTVIDSPKQLRITLWLMMTLLGWYVVSSLIAYESGHFYELQYGNGLEMNRALGVNSMASSPNNLAGMVLVLLPLLIALLRASRRVWERILLVALAGGALAAIVLSGSRTTVLSLMILGPYYLLRSRRRVLYFALGVVMACTIWFSMPTAYQQRYLTVKSYAEGGQLDASNEYRLEVWTTGWKMFLDHPIIGVGAGQFGTAFGLVYGPKNHHQWVNPHNLLLQVVCELGIVGLVVFTYFVVQVRKAISEPLHLRDDPDFRFNYEVGLACNVMFLGVMILSITGHTMYRPFWYLLGGLAAANLNLVRKARSEGIEHGIRETKEKLSVLLSPARPKRAIPSFSPAVPDITNEEFLALFPSEKSSPTPPQVNSSVANSRAGVASIPTMPSVEPAFAHDATLSHPEVVAPVTDPMLAITNADATASPFFIETAAPARPEVRAPDESFLLALPTPSGPNGSPLDSKDPAPPQFNVDSPTADSLCAAESEITPSTELLSDMSATFEPTNPINERQTSGEVTRKRLQAASGSDNAAGVRHEVAAQVANLRSVAPILGAPDISISRPEKSVPARPRAKSSLEGFLLDTRIPGAGDKRLAKDSRIITRLWMTCLTLVRAGWRPAAVFGVVFVVLLVTWMLFERGAFNGLREKMSSSDSNLVTDSTAPARQNTVKTPHGDKASEGVDHGSRQELPSAGSAGVAPAEKPRRHARGDQETEPQRPKSFVWTLSPPIVANRAVQGGGTPEKESPPAIQIQPNKSNGDSFPVAVVGSWDSSAKLTPPQSAPQIPEQGDRLVACSLLYRVEPMYPPEAVQKRIEGTVKLRAVVGRDGRVMGLEVVSGPLPLVSSALSAAREWRFIPALLNGEPVESETDINIEFRLSQEAARQ